MGASVRPAPWSVLSLATLSLILSLSSTTSAECYYPDGSIAKDYTYVSCGGETKACCIPSEKDQCLSNGLCFWPGGNYPFRGACSDKDWGSKCPNVCTTGQLCPCSFISPERTTDLIRCTSQAERTVGTNSTTAAVPSTAALTPRPSLAVTMPLDLSISTAYRS